MRRRTAWVLTVGVWASLAGDAARAQRPFPPATFENLQVLPSDSRAGDLIGVMKGFTQALGVRCQFCHVGEEGQPLEQFDFVTDARASKQTARAMMRLVRQVNATLDQAVPHAGPEPRVTCRTCHAGSTKPAR